MPSGAERIIGLLEKNGFDAYIVGGCVRDVLLGKEPNDWDICTPAAPDRVSEILTADGIRIIGTGIRHGTVTAICGGESYEVTTYRVDGEYSDNRHPDSVTFTGRLEEDLARRDFTINAMAYSARTGIIDPFFGQSDLKAGLIRCVGKPEKRFNEDGLRILRALRFSSQLSFGIERETSDAVHAQRALIGNISAERVRDELCKLLRGAGVKPVLLEYRDVFAEFIPEIAQCFDFEQQNKWHIYDVWRHTVESVAQSENDLTVRLTMLFHDIGKPACFTLDGEGVGHFYGHAKVSEEMTHRIMRRLRFDNDTVSAVAQLVKYHDTYFGDTPASVRRMLGKLGERQLARLISVFLADASAQAPESIVLRAPRMARLREMVSDILRENQCVSLRDLAVNGSDLMDIGMPAGPDIGRVLDVLLEEVVESPEKNSRGYLLGRARELMEL